MNNCLMGAVIRWSDNKYYLGFDYALMPIVLHPLEEGLTYQYLDLYVEEFRIAIQHLALWIIQALEKKIGDQQDLWDAASYGMQIYYQCLTNIAIINTTTL